MVDLVAKIVWYRLREAATSWGERIDRLSHIDEWLYMFFGDDEMDPLGMLLLGWIFLAGIVYFSAEHLRNLLLRLTGEPDNRALPLQQGTNHERLAQTGYGTQRDTSPDRQASYLSKSAASDNPWQRIPEHSTISGAGPSVQSTESLQARVKLINYSQEGSDWVNSVLNWLYHRYNTTPEFADIWLSALNEYAKRNAQQLGVLVTFDRFLPTSRAPKIGDVRAELAADEQLSIYCAVEMVQLGFHLLATTNTLETGVVTDDFEADIDHLRGEVRFLNVNDMRNVQPAPLHTHQCFQLVTKIYGTPQNEIMLSAEFERQPPNIMVTLRAPFGSKPLPEDFDPSVVQQAIRQCIMNAKTTLKLARFRDFPLPFWHPGYSSKPSSPISEPMQTHFPYPSDTSSSQATPTPLFGPGDHQVVVKVVRATGIGGNTAGVEPYCVIEMDEPPQKHTTTIVKSNGANPIWEETYVFDISPDSNEVLFEVYDRAKVQKRNFLGTAIVSLKELGKNPHQRQVIPLQSRPLMDDSVSGTLTLEFTVVETGSPRASEPSAQTTSPETSVRTSGITPNRNSRIFLEETVSSRQAGPVPAGTLAPKTPTVQRSVSEDVSIHQAKSVTNHTVPKRKSSATDGMLRADDGYANDIGRSRSADRKPSVFTRIKRRFSFGKKRSKSLDAATAKAEMANIASTSAAASNGPTRDRVTDPMDGDPEVLAAERAAAVGETKVKIKTHIRSKSAPGSREPSASRSTASNRSQKSWKDKFRSRFSRKKSHEATIITTQEI